MGNPASPSSLTRTAQKTGRHFRLCLAACLSPLWWGRTQPVLVRTVDPRRAPIRPVPCSLRRPGRLGGASGCGPVLSPRTSVSVVQGSVPVLGGSRSLPRWPRAWPGTGFGRRERGPSPSLRRREVSRGSARLQRPPSPGGRQGRAAAPAGGPAEARGWPEVVAQPVLYIPAGKAERQGPFVTTARHGRADRYGAPTWHSRSRSFPGPSPRSPPRGPRLVPVLPRAPQPRSPSKDAGSVAPAQIFTLGLK